MGKNASVDALAREMASTMMITTTRNTPN